MLKLFKIQGVELSFGIACHPHLNGQSEVVNNYVENFIKCFTRDRPWDWFQWVPMAKWWYYTTLHSSTWLTPLQALYGYPPPKLTNYVTKVEEAVEEAL